MTVLVEQATRDRWIGIAGLAFVGLLIVAFILGTAPEADATDAKILDYYEDGGNQVKQIAAAIIVTIALAAFLVFSTGLRLALIDAGAPTPLPDLAVAGALGFAFVALAGIAVGGAVPATFVFSDAVRARFRSGSSGQG
jgi:succinate dehydrogenase/fumarate reductase cytochrome b subunit